MGGNLRGKGSFYVSNQRVVWIQSEMDVDTCYSFGVPMANLNLHALCKDYLFLQIENQEFDIKIIHKSYTELQATYNALCEGQRLNPCELDSASDNDENDTNEWKEDQASMWESKLILPNNDQA